MKSSFLNLKKSDFWKGLILAVLTAILSGLIVVLQSGSDFKTINFYPIWSSAGIAFCSYIIKNLLTNSSDQFLKKEQQ